MSSTTHNEAGTSVQDRTEIESARRYAVGVDLVAIGASLAANVADAPPTIGGRLMASIAPLGLFAMVGLWHRSRVILTGLVGWSFTAGLASIAAGAGYVSFGHLRAIAEANGQTGHASWIVPLVIDATAVLATLVVIASGRALARLDANTLESERVEPSLRRPAPAPDSSDGTVDTVGGSAVPSRVSSTGPVVPTDGPVEAVPSEPVADEVWVERALELWQDPKLSPPSYKKVWLELKAEMNGSTPSESKLYRRLKPHVDKLAEEPAP